MTRKRIRLGIIEMVKEFYKETKNVINVGEEITEESWTMGGLKQGCCLSPTLFKLYIADMEETLRQTLVAGIKVGKIKFCSVAYDIADIVILAKSE